MIGRITGIAGPTVTSDIRGLKLCDMVLVGDSELTGEVVRLEEDRAVVQVYEDTRGLSIGEPVRGTGLPLTVRLGPGLLSSMFDGLQRPLERLRDATGPFISTGPALPPLEHDRVWRFTPARKAGDEVAANDLLGH